MLTTTKMPIALIGYGNIARNLLKGLCAAGYEANGIRTADPNIAETRESNKEIQSFTSNLRAIEGVTTVILCVKPDVVQTVCAEIKEALVRQAVTLVSVAAGVSVDLLQRWTSQTLPIVRCMPNTPSAVGCGMTALYANRHAGDKHKKLVEDIFSTVGSVVWLENEKDMHIVTALSGSGPAYFFRFTEALEKAAEDLGCSADIARKLAVQTLYGAAVLATESHDDLRTLREQITSKGGTTERGLQSMEQADIDGIARSVLKEASLRSIEISEKLEETS